jgi:DNA polymerase
VAPARDDLLRAARQALGDELAGGRWAVLPRGRGEAAGPPAERPQEAAGEAAGPAESAAERLRRFRELRAARSAAAPAAGAVAGPAAPTEAVYRKGLASAREPSVFGEKPLTDPARPAAERLAELARLAEQCSQCALNTTRHKVVFGDGRAGAELLFVGEAPGADEDASGVPFVGRAGQLLNKILAAMGLQREEVYICNVLKCRPPGNRTPLPAEAAECWPYLREQIEIVGPRVICALGAPAVRTLLGTEEPIGRLRGYVHDYHGTPLVATYHPAYLLRNPPEKAKVWEDMKVVLKLLGRPVPKGKAAGK